MQLQYWRNRTYEHRICKLLLIFLQYKKHQKYCFVISLSFCIFYSNKMMEWIPWTEKEEKKIQSNWTWSYFTYLKSWAHVMENLRMWIPKKCASRLSTKQRREMCIRKEELQRLSIYATYTLYAYKTRVIIYKCYRFEKLDYP